MKTKLILTLVVALFLAAQTAAPAAEPSSIETELKALITKVQTKIKEGKKTEEDLAPELKEFDALLAAHKSEQTDEVAQVLMMKAMLYSQVLDNETKGDELLEQLKRDYPNSKQVTMLKREEEAKKTRSSLVTGAAFPNFEVKDIQGKALTLASYQGKVVLIDFWATWCGPCVAELPNVLEAYEKHHDNGFEIIGISLDKDKEKLETFVKQKKMTWRQYFDGQGWQNELAQKYGINSIPATYLLDREGKIIGVGLRGKKLEEAVATALTQK